MKTLIREANSLRGLNRPELATWGGLLLWTLVGGLTLAGLGGLASVVDRPGSAPVDGPAPQEWWVAHGPYPSTDAGAPLQASHGPADRTDHGR